MRARADRLRRPALAIGAALLIVAAFPPLGWWPLVWCGLVPLYAAVVPRDGERPAGALPGFCFGLALYGAGMFWMNRIGALPWALLALTQGAFFALWGSLTARILPRLPAPWRPVAFAAGWTLFEGIRSAGPYAFPWFLLASAHARASALPLLQVVALTGQWGLSFAAAWANGCLAEGLRARAPRWIAAPLALALILAAGGGCRQMGVDADAYNSDVPTHRIAAVQGSEDRGTSRSAAFSLYADLSRQAKDADLIVWPEGTVPGDALTRSEMNQLAREIGTPILAGMIESAPDGTLRNTLRLFPEAPGAPVYTKRQIVPFGEFFPARAVLGPLFERYGVNYPDFVAGTTPGVFDVGGKMTVGTAICYESAFPYVARDAVRVGADVLIFVTSDQTFEKTSELQQHLDLASVRAVETGRWIVRAGSTGISAVVRPDGRVVNSPYAGAGAGSRLDEGKRGVLRAVVSPPTGAPLAVGIGDGFLWLAGLVCAGAAGFAGRRPREDQTGKP